LRSRRIEFKPVRQKLRTLAKSIHREHLEPDIATFIQALVAYFYEFLPQIGSASVDLLEKLERSIERGQTSQEDLLNEWRSIDTYISNSVERHREHWSQVCEAFAPLKVRSALSV